MKNNKIIILSLLSVFSLGLYIYLKKKEKIVSNSVNTAEKPTILDKITDNLKIGTDPYKSSSPTVTKIINDKGELIKITDNANSVLSSSKTVRTLYQK